VEDKSLFKGGIIASYFLGFLGVKENNKRGVKMKKLIVNLGIFLLIVGLFFAVTEFSHVAYADDIITLRLNTVAGPEQAQVKGYEAARDYIWEKSEGRVELSVFHSGLLGEAADVVLDVHEGATDISVISPTWMMEFYKPAGALEAPYVVRDYNHLYKVLESDIGWELLNGFESATNTVVLDNWYFGIRHTFSTRKATNPEEFDGMIYRVPDSPLFFDAAEVLGASPTPMPVGEVYLGFETGAMQATFFPYGDAYANAFHEVTDYVIKTGDVVYSIQPIIHEDKWNEIPEEYQDIILEGFKVGREVNNDIVLDAEVTKEDVFREYGLEIVEVDLEPFIERAEGLWEDYGWTEVVQEIQAVE